MDRTSRKYFLLILLELGQAYETLILHNTLLLTDTEELLNASNSHLYWVLKKYQRIMIILKMAQLQTNSIEEVAMYYMVPESVINFKKIEYDRQDTIELIREKKLSEKKIISLGIKT